jgi:hypothetical protein
MNTFLRTTLVFLLAASFGDRCLALDASKLPEGANHARAHRYATGENVTVGVFDTVPYGVLSPHRLGDRLLAQYSFAGKLPSQAPDPLLVFADDHERLSADIVAGDDPVFTGVAPQASVYDIAIDSTSFDSRRAGSSWVATNHDVRVFNLSASFGTNANGTGSESLFWDWFVHNKQALVAVAAGNTGGQLGIPADSYNGISVGAYDQADMRRASFSAFTLSGGIEGAEVRGKPDILAPGVWVGDGISYDGWYAQGTSFAAPHVTGTAALLADYAGRNPTSDPLGPRGMKALILNSARKRQLIGPESVSAVSYDRAAASSLFDKDYLNCGGGDCTIQTPGTATSTDEWSPSAWNYSSGKFSVTKPLDDEQGVGYLDATRAIINLAGDNSGPGLVAGIGWDESVIAPSDLPSAHTYAINQVLAAGSFLTATLVWDRIVIEGDANGIVNDVDTYSFGELANLDLRVLDAVGAVIAESISMTDNVEHLHVPLPANAASGDYKLQVSNTGGALATDFALAWWTDPTPLVPGDYNLDGTVDTADYQVWRAGFGDSTDTKPLIHGDGNKDGTVDAADYAVWRDHVGDVWPGIGAGSMDPIAVPEPPSSLSLIVVSIFASWIWVCRSARLC